MTIVTDYQTELWDAKVEALWRLGEPRIKASIKLTCSIPLVTDGDVTIANEAIQAIAAKHGIPRHDLNMLRRAFLMQLFHAYVRTGMVGHAPSAEA
jgi:hypothetical protein